MKVPATNIRVPIVLTRPSIFYMPNTLAARRLIVLAGPQNWGRQAASELISRSRLQPEQLHWLAPDDKSSGLLGQERALLIMDTYQGLNPDVFGRVSGLVQAGGALLLICPSLNNWANYPDPENLRLVPYPEQQNIVVGFYLKRWIRLLKAFTGIEHLSPENGSTISPISVSLPDHPRSRACNADQQRAIAAICKTATGRRRRPAIIRADRGRGKSAALGLAAGLLLDSRKASNILVTAGGFSQVYSLFKHAQAAWPEAEMQTDQKCLSHPHAKLSYIAVDALIMTPRDCDLLIVDEASTLGIARLDALLQLYPRIAFSGTEHGYEGSGRGFALKFQQLIQTHSRGQQAVKLNAPIRWASGDPLEYWTNRLLLLDSEQATHGTAEAFQAQDLKFLEIRQSELATDEIRLSRVFGLLVDAHYQTRPVDCRYLLDAPNSRLFVAEHQRQIIGLVWLMLEGELETDIAREIVAGRRRPQGHLVPQILAAHLGLEEAVTQRCARIQRIAVCSRLQGRGFGSWMLEQTEKRVGNDIDYFASSFGADLPLSNFWRRSGYRAARISDKPQAASGLHSVVVLKATTAKAQRLCRQSWLLFGPQLVNQLAGSLSSLSADLACSIAPYAADQLVLDRGELKAAVLFAYAQRPYESSLAALTKIAQFVLLNLNPGSDLGPDLEPEMRKLLIKRMLQNQPWSVCTRNLNITGYQDGVKQLRAGVRSVLEFAAPGKEVTELRKIYNS